MKALRSNAPLTNSGPLSSRIVVGDPTSSAMRLRRRDRARPSAALSRVDRRRTTRERVDGRQRADLAAVEPQLMNDVHCPDFIRGDGAGSPLARLRFATDLGERRPLFRLAQRGGDAPLAEPRPFQARSSARPGRPNWNSPASRGPWFQTQVNCRRATGLSSSRTRERRRREPRLQSCRRRLAELDPATTPSRRRRRPGRWPTPHCRGIRSGRPCRSGVLRRRSPNPDGGERAATRPPPARRRRRQGARTDDGALSRRARAAFPTARDGPSFPGS